MASLKIIRLGHPSLRKRSTPVSLNELKTKKFQKFLDDLADTCIKNDGVGIAAPQVAVNKRVIVVHVDSKNPRYRGKKPYPLTIVVNPKIISESKIVKEDWEGDLSANLRGLVPRAKACVVEGLGRDGNRVEYDLKYDFHARVFIHEIDHLNGIFFSDHVIRKETLSELAEWNKYWKPKPKKK